MTIRCFETQDFTPTLVHEEQRDIAEEGDDISKDDWNETTLEETLETIISEYDFEYEGIPSDSKSEEPDEDDANYGDRESENEGQSEVNDGRGSCEQEDNRGDCNEEGIPDMLHDIEVTDEVMDEDDELLGDSLSDSMEITQEMEEELLGLSDTGPFGVSTPSKTGD